MLSFLSKSKLIDQIKYVFRICFIIVVVLFVDSFNRSFKVQEDHHDHKHDIKTDSFIHAKLFQAQRNMYLTGSVIFLSLVLNRFFYLIQELQKNTEKTEVLKQQAAKTTKEYLKLLDKEQEWKSAEGLKKELEIVKKQAEQTHKAYMELTDRYAALEGKTGDKKLE
jgi:hypothetical protein